MAKYINFRVTRENCHGNNEEFSVWMIEIEMDKSSMEYGQCTKMYLLIYQSITTRDDLE